MLRVCARVGDSVGKREFRRHLDFVREFVIELLKENLGDVQSLCESWDSVGKREFRRRCSW